MFTSYYKPIKILLLALIILLPSILCLDNALAQSQLITVGPVVNEILLKPGQSDSFDVVIINNTEDVREFEILVRSMPPNEEGTPTLRPEANQIANEWIILPQNYISLNKNEKEVLTIDVHVPLDASPGSYHMAILFRDILGSVDASGTTLAGELGPAVILTVLGSKNVDLNIVSFNPIYYINDSSGQTFDVQFRNDGNVTVLPVGVVNIKDVWGISSPETISINFNEDNQYIWRQSKRNILSQWIDDQFRIGFFEAELVLAYGPENQVIASKTYFWILPWKLILAVISAILLAVVWGKLKKIILYIYYDKKILK